MSQETHYVSLVSSDEESEPAPTVARESFASGGSGGSRTDVKRKVSLVDLETPYHPPQGENLLVSGSAESVIDLARSTTVARVKTVPKRGDVSPVKFSLTAEQRGPIHKRKKRASFAKLKVSENSDDSDNEWSSIPRRIVRGLEENQGTSEPILSRSMSMGNETFNSKPLERNLNVALEDGSPGAKPMKRARTLESLSPAIPAVPKKSKKQANNSEGGQQQQQQQQQQLQILSEKERRKREREDAKKLQRVRNVEKRLGNQVAHGKFAHLEVVPVLEKSFSESSFGQLIGAQCICEDIFVETREMNSGPGVVWFERRKFLPAPNHEDPKAVLAHANGKRPVLASDENPADRDLLNNAVLIFWDKTDFAERCSRGYRCLRPTVRKAKAAWGLHDRKCTSAKQSDKPRAPKIVVILSGIREELHAKLAEMRKELRATQKENQDTSVLEAAMKRCTPQGLEMAKDFLMVSEACDVRLIGSSPDDYMKIFTSMLESVQASLYYRLPCALEVLALYKRFGRIDSCFIDKEKGKPQVSKRVCPSLSRAEVTRTWILQLQCVNGMSEPMARRIADVYPTFSSLMSVYLDDTYSTQQKEDLLTELPRPGKRSPSISQTLHRLLTSRDPNEIIL